MCLSFIPAITPKGIPASLIVVRAVRRKLSALTPSIPIFRQAVRRMREALSGWMFRLSQCPPKRYLFPEWGLYCPRSSLKSSEEYRGSAGEFTLAVALANGHVGANCSGALVGISGELGTGFIDTTGGVEPEAKQGEISGSF